MKATKAIISTVLVTALASSMCCIAPLLALLSGSTWIMSNVEEITHLRPYFVGFTVFFLAYSWWRQLTLKNSAAQSCDCEVGTMSFFQGKTLLVIVTIFSGIMLAFPYFSEVLVSENKGGISMEKPLEVQQIHMEVEGMTCTGCEVIVNHQINELEGIMKVQTSYKNASTTVIFDASKTTIKQLEKAVNSTGYKAILISKL